MKGDLGTPDGQPSPYAGVKLQAGPVLLDDDVNEERSCIWLLLVVVLGLLVLALFQRRRWMPRYPAGANG